MKSFNIEVFIIGGGIVGSLVVLVLVKVGCSVIILECDLCGVCFSGINYGGVCCQGWLEVQLLLL